MICAHPIRVIPFDLGRSLSDRDTEDIRNYITKNFKEITLSSRQLSILKKCVDYCAINDHVTSYIYRNGMAVMVITEPTVEFFDDYQHFAIPYGENRKRAHGQLFRWEHEDSECIRQAVSGMRSIVKSNTKKTEGLRTSSLDTFENKGLSYVMTLSMFDVVEDGAFTPGYKNYPEWLKKNLYALLDPSSLYLEDSSKFESANDTGFDIKKILDSIEPATNFKDYERHRHIDTFMSWAAVTVVGNLQSVDIEEYVALEVQLQCDWFYVYCLEKGLDGKLKPSKQHMIELQKENYELDLLENRLYDFDDSSMPTRVLDIQKGLVETSGLENNIRHLQRKIKYILEREALNSTLRQKRLGQSSEILLFIIAFIQIAPTVADYGNRLISHGGTIVNCLILVLGLFLLIRKE